jgi:F-type H+-transporting ATPase subunit delta
MAQTAVALKYAKALFDTALESGKLPEVTRDADFLRQLREEDPAFLNFLISPEVLTDQKMEFVKTVFEPRLDPLTVNFIRLLIDKGRIDHLPPMRQEFDRLQEEHQGKLKAQVMTAVPLSGEQESRLKVQLDRITGKNVEIEKQVDPAILGGVVVHLGNKIIDRSLRNGLRQLEESLLRVEIN